MCEKLLIIETLIGSGNIVCRTTENISQAF